MELLKVIPRETPNLYTCPHCETATWFLTGKRDQSYPTVEGSHYFPIVSVAWKPCKSQEQESTSSIINISIKQYLQGESSKTSTASWNKKKVKLKKMDDLLKLLKKYYRKLRNLCIVTFKIEGRFQSVYEKLSNWYKTIHFVINNHKSRQNISETFGENHIQQMQNSQFFRVYMECLQNRSCASHKTKTKSINFKILEYQIVCYPNTMKWI